MLRARKMINPPMVTLIFFATVILGSGRGMAQLELASFRGTVKDDQRQPIAEATIHLKDLARGTEITFKTNKKGSFYRRGL